MIQILETQNESCAPEHVLCDSKHAHDNIYVTHKVYGELNPGPASALEVLINVYESELQKRISQGYLPVDLDNSIEQNDLEAVPSEQTLTARDVLYGLLGLVLEDPGVTFVFLYMFYEAPYAVTLVGNK